MMLSAVLSGALAFSLHGPSTAMRSRQPAAAASVRMMDSSLLDALAPAYQTSALVPPEFTELMQPSAPQHARFSDLSLIHI